MRSVLNTSFATLVSTVMLLVVLVGCATSPAAPVAPPTGDSKDRVTASDETDASRRARVRMELASAYFGRGQLTVALDEVKLAIAADPTLGEAHNLRGLIYASLGDERLAEESFRRALQINARDTDSMQNLGWFLCQHQRYAEAEALFKQLVAALGPRDPARALLAQGVCQARAGQWAEAEATLLRSYELDPANPTTAVNLAEVHYRRGDFERARVHMRRINAMPAVMNAQTLWLAMRIENRLGNRDSVQQLGDQLLGRFRESREAKSFEKGQFDE